MQEMADGVMREAADRDERGEGSAAAMGTWNGASGDNVGADWEIGRPGVREMCDD